HAVVASSTQRSSHSVAQQNRSVAHTHSATPVSSHAPEACTLQQSPVGTTHAPTTHASAFEQLPQLEPQTGSSPQVRPPHSAASGHASPTPSHTPAAEHTAPGVQLPQAVAHSGSGPHEVMLQSASIGQKTMSSAEPSCTRYERKPPASPFRWSSAMSIPSSESAKAVSAAIA